MENTVFSALQQHGFSPVGDNICVGTWKNYAVSLNRISAQTYNVFLAIRIPKASKELKKTIKAELKSAGLRYGSISRVMPNFLHATYAFTKTEDALRSFPAFLDLLIGVLTQNGIGPANTCAITGAANPDSLCLVDNAQYCGYQPVFSTAVRQNDYAVQSKAEENEMNGSYLTGIIGAVLGAVVGIAVNLLTIVFLHRIFAWLFALIPIGAMFGYKLLKGKANKVSIAVAVVLSLLAVPVMMIMDLAIECSKELNVSFADGIDWAIRNFTNPIVMDAIRGDLIKMVIFMAIGIVFAWGFMHGALNSTQVQDAQLRLGSMRPNPNCAGFQQPVEQQPAEQIPQPEL